MSGPEGQPRPPQGLDASVTGGARSDAAPLPPASPGPDRPRDAGGPAPEPDAAKPTAGAADASATTRLDAATAGTSDAAPGTASGPAKPQCLKDTDCVLANDCCNCQALPKDEKPQFCDPKIACVQTRCMEYGGIERARCIVGRCVLALDCDTSTVTCKRAAPTCAAGQVPRVIGVPSVRCYGECTDARQCAGVPGCAACGKDDVCVKAPEPNRWHCVPPVAACGANQTCACAGPAICTPPTPRCEQSPGTRELACGG